MAPGEARWRLGGTGKIAPKLEKEEVGLQIDDLFRLAPHGRNSHIHHVTVFSPHHEARS